LLQYDVVTLDEVSHAQQTSDTSEHYYVRQVVKAGIRHMEVEAFVWRPSVSK